MADEAIINLNSTIFFSYCFFLFCPETLLANKARYAYRLGLLHIGLLLNQTHTLDPVPTPLALILPSHSIIRLG